MVSMELDKVRKQIEESNKIYEILEEFKYNLQPNEIKERYFVMMAPKSILDDVDKKKKELDIKKNEFEQQLTMQQQEFKTTIESLNRSISQFHTYNKKEQHAEISQKVNYINEALSNCLQESKKFNSRENLFEKEITDYSKVQDLAKEFLPYSNLWLTTTNWI